MNFKRTRIIVVAVIAIGISIVAASGSSAPRTPSPAARSVWDGVYTEEQEKRGDAIYSKTCSSCHGLDLSGVDEAPPLSGSPFLSNWDTLSIGDLSERIRISMPPTSPGKLSRQEVVDIISHILKVNNFPAGKTDLARELETLKQITIEASKPKAKSE